MESMVDVIIAGFASSSEAVIETSTGVLPLVLGIFGALTALGIGFRLWRRGAGKRA